MRNHLLSTALTTFLCTLLPPASARAVTFTELNNRIFDVTVQLQSLDTFYAVVQTRSVNQRLKVEATIPKIDARPVSPTVKAALLAKALAIVAKLEAVQSLRDEIANEVTNITCYYEAAKQCRDRGALDDGMVAADEANRSCAAAFGIYSEIGRQQDAIDVDITALLQLVDA